MLQMLKSIKWNVIAVGIIYLVLGGFLIADPDATIELVCLMVGIAVILAGAFQILRYFVRSEGDIFPQLGLVFGAVCVAVGVFLVSSGEVVLSILPVLFGIFVLCDSVVRIQEALELRRGGWKGWPRYLLLGAVSVGLGLVMIFNPFATLKTLVQFAGIALCVEGLIHLAGTIFAAVCLRRLTAAAQQGETVPQPSDQPAGSAQRPLLEAEAREVDDESDPQ